jgi:hypothetical protein
LQGVPEWVSRASNLVAVSQERKAIFPAKHAYLPFTLSVIGM